MKEVLVDATEVKNESGEVIGTAQVEKGESAVERLDFMANLMKTNIHHLQNQIHTEKLSRKEIIDLLIYSLSYPVFEPEKIKINKIRKCAATVEECLSAKQWIHSYITQKMIEVQQEEKAEEGGLF